LNGGKRGEAPTKLLKSATGFARPGSVLSIMGPACSGKKTLLKALADQLPKNAKLYGEILLNGFRQRLPYGTYVSSWALFFLSPYVARASRKLVSLSISISIELLDQN
jgi:ABC-type dipeptide/oligopeptide/nickel transport system ATPase subunit